MSPASVPSTTIKQHPVIIGKGLRAILCLYKTPSVLDAGNNLLYGYRVTSFTRGGTTVDQVQLTPKGIKALFAPGNVTPGDITVGLAHDPELGEPPLLEIPSGGITYVPQAVLWLGILDP
jgi:hypothetical protein